MKEKNKLTANRVKGRETKRETGTSYAKWRNESRKRKTNYPTHARGYKETRKEEEKG